MAVAKLLNLLALSCLAILASYGPAPVAAVSVTSHHHARSNLHAVVAKRKRAETSQRCKPRPSTSAAPKSDPPKPSVPSVNPPPPKSAPAPKPAYTPAPSNTPKPQPPPSSGGGNGSAKVGIAWPLGNDKSIQSFKTPKVRMYYTWSPWCVKAADEVGMQCCPMLWGDKQVSQFTSLVKPGYAKCALGFNEPDQPGQANMSPEHAVDLWWKHLNPLKDQGYRLGSPAITASPNGDKWIAKFMQLCQGCHIDFMTFHFYGTDPQAFIKYAQKFYDTYKKPIQVTEFACQNFGGGAQANKDQVFNFMDTVTNWMDNTWFIESYYAFGAMHDMYNVNYLNRLLGDNNKPTDLGYKYIYG